MKYISQGYIPPVVAYRKGHAQEGDVQSRFFSERLFELLERAFLCRVLSSLHTGIELRWPRCRAAMSVASYKLVFCKVCMYSCCETVTSGSRHLCRGRSRDDAIGMISSRQSQITISSYHHRIHKATVVPVSTRQTLIVGMLPRNKERKVSDGQGSAIKAAALNKNVGWHVRTVAFAGTFRTVQCHSPATLRSHR